MSKGNTTENDVLLNIFNGTAFSWNANTDLFVSLHTADPGESGSQTTSETAYTGYSRQTVARSGSGWTVSGNTATNTSIIAFPVCTAGTSTVTHVAIGTASSGAGQILYKGALTSSLAVSLNIQPTFGASSITITED